MSESGSTAANEDREDEPVPQHSASDSEPIRQRVPRAPLPLKGDRRTAHARGMSHDELVEALRGIEELDDVGQGSPNFQFHSRPFLHFHDHPDGMYADVRLGRGDFQPVWASTPSERFELLALVHDHVEHVNRSTKQGRDRPNRQRRRR